MILVQIFTPMEYGIETPESIDIKYGTGDYVQKTKPYIKFDTNLSTRVFGLIRSNSWVELVEFNVPLDT